MCNSVFVRGKLAFSFLFLLISFNISAQTGSYKLEGFLYEAQTTTPVANATIKLNKGQSIKTGDNGYYSFLLPAGTIQVRITHLAYDTLYQQVNIKDKVLLNFYLQPRSSLMAEVRISGNSRKSGADHLASSVHTLSKKDLNKVPDFLGQKDPVKALQTLPGTGKGGEGNSGFYVRGGTSGQNLTLFNEAVVYNPSHLMGFFSVFNSGAVDNVKLHKSIPAEYGGRLSSIIEVNSSKTIADSLSIDGDISMLSASANADIPISSNWSVKTSARKTFMNYTVWPIMNALGTSSIFDEMKYDFNDLNLNSNARIGRSNYLNFSAYTGGDAFGFNMGRYNMKNSMDWRNTAYSLNLKTIIGDKIVLNHTATHSAYKFSFGMSQDKYQARIESKIKDYNLKSTLNIYLDKHSIKTGLQYTDHIYKPNTPFINSSGTVYDLGEPNVYYFDESSLFASDEFSISKKASLYGGIRLTYFRHKGPYSLEKEDQSTVSYRKNSLVSSVSYFEPSISFKYDLSKNSSVKLSYSKNTQPVHLVSVTAVNFPADFWMPSVGNVAPEKGSQLSLGFFRNIVAGYESYIDLYYKEMSGLVEFSGGIMNLIDNLKIEDNLLFGSGDAYGSEFFIKKKTGKLTGWLGYTLAWSNRHFELINDSDPFPAKFDRRHDLSLVANYALNNKWTLSSSFTYASGNAYTSPSGRYMLGGNIINEYGRYNGSRMPAYHRMDIAATYVLKSKKLYSTELSFSIYNVYNRQNPIYIYFMAEGDLDKQRVSVQPRSVALLPVLPSVTYRFKFKNR